MLATQSHGITESTRKAEEINPINNAGKQNRNMVNGYDHDTNNNTATSRPRQAGDTSRVNEEKREEDDFDMTSAPLSRGDMVKNRNQATQETLEFVYKTSTKIAPPVGSTSLLSGALPNYAPQIPVGQRVTHRRGSGVPPPPRELKSTDFLARRAAAASISMEEASEEEEN